MWQAASTKGAYGVDTHTPTDTPTHRDTHDSNSGHLIESALCEIDIEILIAQPGLIWGILIEFDENWFS